MEKYGEAETFLRDSLLALSCNHCSATRTEATKPLELA